MATKEKPWSPTRSKPKAEQLYVKRGQRFLAVDDRRNHSFDKFPGEGVWLVLQQFGAIQTASLATLDRPCGEDGALEYGIELNGEVRQVADMLPVMQFAQLWPLVERLRDALKEHEQERWRLYEKGMLNCDRLSQFTVRVVQTLAAQLLDEKERWKHTGNEVELARAQMPFSDVLQLVDIAQRLLHPDNSHHDRAEILLELLPFVEGKDPVAFLLEQLLAIWAWARTCDEALREWEPVADLIRTDAAFRGSRRSGDGLMPQIAFDLLRQRANEWHARNQP